MQFWLIPVQSTPLLHVLTESPPGSSPACLDPEGGDCVICLPGAPRARSCLDRPQLPKGPSEGSWTSEVESQGGRYPALPPRLFGTKGTDLPMFEVLSGWQGVGAEVYV